MRSAPRAKEKKCGALLFFSTKKNSKEKMRIDPFFLRKKKLSNPHFFPLEKKSGEKKMKHSAPQSGRGSKSYFFNFMFPKEVLLKWWVQF